MQTFLALLIGCVLTYFYLQDSYQPPAFFEVNAKLKAIPEQVLASEFLESPDSDMSQKQRALAVLVKYDSDYFIALDTECGHCLTRLAVKQVDTKRIRYAVQWMKAYDKAQIPKHYQAIAAHYSERFDTTEPLALRMAMMNLYLKRHPDTLKLLQKRSPGLSKDEIVRDLILSTSQ